ncbi:MAG TPA: RDD family protein [Thermoanaerobaculia bacterium]|nr:RDD family protein [Thermoanaerobaculia bacterium]
MSAITLAKPRILRVVTPEGLALPFVVGPVGDRVSAFLFDLLLIVLATVGLWLLTALSALLGLKTLGFPVAIIVMFLLWNFYFVYFEVHWGGVTWGKRRAELRVISRDGGPLTAEAIIARNLMRNLELNLPVLVLLAPEQMLPEAPAWGRLLAAVWLLVFALMPLFNQDRLRCGDLVAGTLVVKMPAAVLLGDLADRGDAGERAVRRPAARGSLPVAAAAPSPFVPAVEAYPFTRQQLDIYGIHELQVLEDLLRRHDQGILDSRVLDEVGEKIKTKIGWPRERWHDPTRPFLDAFYRAQRALLEQKMLFGQRQERKKG